MSILFFPTWIKEQFLDQVTRTIQITLNQLIIDGIQCGTAHFEALDVSFKHITSAAEV